MLLYSTAKIRLFCQISKYFGKILLFSCHNTKIERQFYQKEQCTAAIAGVALKAMPYQAVEEIHHYTGGKNHVFPLKDDAHMGGEKVEGEYRQKPLDGKANARLQGGATIYHLCLGFRLGAGVGHHADYL